MKETVLPFNRARWAKISGIIFVFLTLGELVTAAPRDHERLLRAEREELAYQWAPLVWLHPDEQFYPSSVMNFLQNVVPSEIGSGDFVTINNGHSPVMLLPLPKGRASWDTYLLSSYNSECRNCPLPKYLYGKKPGRQHSPPVYATILNCNFPKHNTRDSIEPHINHEGFLNDAQSHSNNEEMTPEPSILLTSTIPSPNTGSHNQTKENKKLHSLTQLHDNSSQSNFSESQVKVTNLTKNHTKINLPSPVNPTSQSFLESDKNFDITSPTTKTTRPTTNITNNSGVSLVNNIQNDQDAYSQQNAILTIKNENSHKADSKDKKRDVNYDSNQLFSVTYWMFYPYNYAKDLCTVNLGIFGRLLKPTINGVCHGEKIAMGNHIGDWEHITIQFKGRTPTKMYVSSHNFGAYYTYDSHNHLFYYTSQDTRKGMPLSPKYPYTLHLLGTHPILFSALGSHGLWATPGIHQYNSLPLLDDNTGEGTAWETWNNLEMIDLRHQNTLTTEQKYWLFYEGHWGNPKRNCHALMGGFCEINHGPTGIPRKRINFPCPR